MEIKKCIQFYRKKAAVWVDRICTSKLSVHDAWSALQTTILRALEYPLAATTITWRECSWIMSPAIEQGLKSS